MTEQRERMMSAFKTRFVPALRERGFVGSFPHFRRLLPERVDYLMVQFYSVGGSFVVEIGRTGPQGFTDGPWKELPVDKINVGHIYNDRRRLTPRDAHGGCRGGDWCQGNCHSSKQFSYLQPPTRHQDLLASRTSFGLLNDLSLLRGSSFIQRWRLCLAGLPSNGRLIRFGRRAAASCSTRLVDAHFRVDNTRLT